MSLDGSGLIDLTERLAGARNPAWGPFVPTPFKNASKQCKGQPADYRNHGQCVKANK